MYIIKCDYYQMHNNYEKADFCDRKVVYRTEEGKIKVLGFIARNEHLNPKQIKERKDKFKEFAVLISRDLIKVFLDDVQYTKCKWTKDITFKIKLDSEIRI